MAFKMTKTQQAVFDRLTLAAREKRNNLDEARLNYNDATDELKTFMEELAEIWRGQFDEKSESWKDGDKGTAVDGWITAWSDYAERLKPIEFDDLPDFEDDLPEPQPED
jgi:hypothetical protein